MKIKITIVGVGNIGKRHLQAVSRLAGMTSVLCFDINRETLAGVERFCIENNLRFNDLIVTDDYRRMLECLDGETVVIVATTAKDRQPLLEDIISCHPLALVVEKPLCQNRCEYENIIAVADKCRVPLYIHLNRHLFPFYQMIKNDLKGRRIVNFSASFPDGMACIGIHMLELATWLLDVSEYRILQVLLDKKYETKRKGFYDFTGKMLLLLDGDKMAAMEALDNEGIFAISLTTTDRGYTIYEFARKIIIAEANNEIRILDVDVPYVSQTTDLAIKDILAGSVPQLPTAKEAYIAHCMLFDFIAANDLEGVNIT